jgi:hypothetical protein
MKGIVLQVYSCIFSQQWQMPPHHGFFIQLLEIAIPG